MLRFEDTTWLNALWLLPLIPVIAWFSTALQSRRRRTACACIRTIIVAAVVVALARPVYEYVEHRQLPAVVIALQDISESVATETTAIHELWSHYQSPLPDGVYGEHVAFADTTSPSNEPTPINPGETNIEAAIDWAVERLGPNPNAHILLFSDGRSTRGQSLPAAARAAEVGIRLHTVPVGKRLPADPRIVGVTPPEDARVGTTGHALVRVRTDKPTKIVLTLVDGNGIEAARLDTRVTGETTVGLPLKPTRKGLHTWSVLLRTGKGSDAHLDTADLGFDVAGPPNVLVCDPQPLSLAALQQVLRQIRFDHRVITPAEFPADHETLAAYDVVVLSDCEQPGLGNGQQNLLGRYVNSGGGLVFIGGRGVSTKKWHGSPLEQLLPIDFAPTPIREKQRLKPVHVCYVLDVSGSMEETLGLDQSGPVTKFAMMKAAVAASLDALPATAAVTIIVFDINHQVVLEAVPIDQRNTIKTRVARLGVGGGTNMVPALVEAVQILSRTDVSKHLILLTDGISSEDPPKELSDWISAARISLTAVAVGAGSNTALLQRMATETQGVYHYCGDATRIPRVFVREAEHISTLAAIEQPPIQPLPGPHPDFLRDIAPDGWPLLEAAVPAKPKQSPAVEIPLVSDRKEPLLARWRVGMGSVTAFLSDAKPSWARRWVQWPRFERFWAKILSSALPASSTLQAATDIRIDGDRCIALLSVFDEQGRPPLDVMPTGHLAAEADPDQPPIPLRWRRLPSGVFEGHAAVQPSIRYLGSISVRNDAGGAVLRRRFIVTGSLKTESLESGPARKTLRALAAAGNGLYAPSPEHLRAAIGEQRSVTITVVKSYWQWLVMLALALWPLDVATRRLGTQP